MQCGGSEPKSQTRAAANQAARARAGGGSSARLVQRSTLWEQLLTAHLLLHSLLFRSPRCSCHVGKWRTATGPSALHEDLTQCVPSLPNTRLQLQCAS